ncbi:kelch domain-containing protein 3-like [Thrips palmi]|uniref:Kelch domain-containing protein 3-like n=1 Tax=Thrips palmi TaxID=161013 RepID=A0A6P8YYV2_THRPL|nr:kelch domain-containing protein 3-like [Thrips palmi]XP_034242462.1 kelch domain-containing protein 3-like [Thrips palmi]XP_034242463.1 kelch domain-containing protein 3-like [Thrips palmi]XP_034242464.1 kelch domain-containing protein 3-like [Thrips palmi]
MYWTVHLEGGPRRVNHAAAPVDDLIYSFGGYNTAENYYEYRAMDVHVLSTGNLRWHKLPSPSYHGFQHEKCIPFQRYGHTAVSHGKYVYVWGGRNEQAACNQIFVFDTETLTWSRPKATGMVPAARDGHTACIINNRMYVFGGYEEGIERFSNDVYYLDLATMKWHYVMASGEVAKFRDFHSASAIGSCMYVFGGRGDLNGPYGSHNEEYCSDIIYFDAESNRWYKPATTGERPKGRRSHSSFIVNGMLYIFGGFNGLTEEHFNDLHCFNPNTCEWKQVIPHGKPPVRRRRQSCIPIGNKVYIFGGTSPWLEVLGEVHSDEAEEVQFVEQNPFDVEDNQDNVNHNGNLEEENEDDININLIDEGLFHGHALIPLGHDIIPLGHDVQNQEEEENPDDMESDDESLFDEGMDAKLMDLNDLHVLDLLPSLYTLCLKTICEHRIDPSGLPEIIRKEFHFHTTPNSISQ